MVAKFRPYVVGAFVMDQATARTRRDRRSFGHRRRYPSEAKAIFAAFATRPSSVRKGAISTLVKALKACGAWSLIDVFYILAATDAQAASVNWKNPGTLSLTAVNSPTFAADRGYTGDGATSYLTTGYDPSVSSLGYAQNDGHAAAFVLTTSVSTAFDFGCGNTRTRVRGRSAGNAGIAVSAETGSGSGGTSSVPHHTMGIRRDVTNQLGYDNGVLTSTNAVASTGLPDAFEVLRSSGTIYSDRQIACAHVGRALSDAQAAAVSAAVRAYMQGVGAA